MSFTKALGWTVAAGAAFVLAGCGSAPIPLSKNFELTSQYKVRSAGHWELLSRDVVAQTRATLEKAGYAPNTPLHVAAPAQPSAFDLGFRDFLITEFVQEGATVQQGPGAALEVSYNTQVVRHNSDRPHFIPGQFTMLAAGVMAAYGLRHEHLDTKLLATLGLTTAADYANSINSGGPTNTELILTTTVSRAGQYVARKTDVYYLENADTPLFLRPAHYRAVNMKVVSQ
ncbi:hypothetical protein ALDI51_44840 [Alicycliphilus denitrificans]|jgi:hypothetical protein|uniref:Lipoprotein n=2 Tax=Burkholderiales TaxID=80840 RepID=A0A420K9S2_9BURK|nr:hypothetical protein [Alicycliphilus denitrificans]OJW92007.1 MAG: hypothetical protein BGO66_13115 [Alicycliphilus sp. 69-12]ADV01977.1 hypothetical protein Alide_4276 [Alicycliphilus denitrificans BC]MBN9573474.1 hypothetical protein [Alicycliphilus denitrificans]RKJ95525.1 hypothetical protein CE154_016445 [Alicycliphilus denitrificans]BCN41165.1 hypothetical protein ALDI51_44840 [Alicycliphilus denitrificans]